MERPIKEQVGEATWESWPIGARMVIADAQATIAALQARVKALEQWVQDQSTANLETMRHVDEMQSRAMDAESQLTQRTAELERVRLLSSHNERRFEMLEEKYKELRTLIAALPKVEEEIAVKRTEVDLSDVWGITLNGYFTFQSALFDGKEEAESYAAILKHRQGMEG